jgi:hypothetical protein
MGNKSIAQVKELLKQGVPYRKIAKQTGWTPQQVTAIAATLGLRNKVGRPKRPIDIGPPRRGTLELRGRK